MAYTLKKRKCKNFKNPIVTCYTKKNLIKIAHDWNNKNPNMKITNIQNKKKIILWNDLKNNFKTEREDLWTDFMNKPFFCEESFAPLVPTHWNNDKYAWLSDLDISNAMKFYQDKYKNFHFIEPAPIDFDAKDTQDRCLYSDLCKYNYDTLYKKYHYVGIVFNTDPHDKPGQHWISLFIHLKKGEISYFDSTGDNPPIEIRNLIDRFKIQGQKLLKQKIKLNINKIQHQKLYSECGVYCLAFIHHMLVTDGDFDIFNIKRIPDEKIQFLRGFFFDDINEIYIKS